MVNTLIFDFDGTLADTSQGIIEAQHAMIAELGLPDVPDERIKQGIGLPIGLSAKVIIGVPEDRIEEATISYRRNFDNLGLPACELFPGIRKALFKLKEMGYTLAIATSRNSITLFSMLDNFGIRDIFSAVSHQDLNLPVKPAPDLVQYVLNQLGKKPEEAIVIGDTTYDLGMGRNAGCKVCAVTYGNHTRRQLEDFGPEWIIDDFKDIFSIL